jgi:biopolymer transport protein ExbB/TolQ
MKRKWATAGVVFGMLLFTGPLWGLAGTVLGMAGTLNRIQYDPSQPTPADLAGGISNSVLATAIGLLAAPIGLAILIPSIVVLVKAYREDASTCDDR